MPPPDAEAAEAAAARLMGRAADGLWRYATADGSTAFYIARWNLAAARKAVRTLSWDMFEGWRLAAWPSGRPLFQLTEILRRPDVGVVVCEGERAAEAAATIFTDKIATTSCCGASQASRTDWRPLSGREVLIWPDHDEPGAAYGREVAHILSGLGCPVVLVEPAAVGSERRDGAPNPPPQKWDAADAILQWGDLAALRSEILAASRPFG